MNKPLFSICIIAKNEGKTLPRLIDSLKEFQQRGGDINILDTGSTDDTISIAKKAGCNVNQAGEKFIIEIKNFSAINQRFVVEGEKQVVKKGDKYFDFSAARNGSAEMATRDIIFCYDGDEINARMDIDKINELITQGYTQFEYQFTFAFDRFGNETVKFIQNKSYHRSEMRWCGIVHELLTPYPDKAPKRIYLDETVYKLAHYQNQQTGRHSYLTGLAYDCYTHPNADRQSHYFAREMMYNGRPKSAIKEFKRHITMHGWLQERAQSAIYIGDCYGQLNEPSLQAQWYNAAFYMDNSRREPVLKLAFFYLHNKNFQSAVCYGKAALEIPLQEFYANNMADYREVPHEILYQAYGWLGNIVAAQEHILKALSYQPHHPMYLRDTKFYFEYWDHGIEGWMKFPELQWLYETSKKYDRILEGGSWKGRSTHALCSGCKGTVTAVDTWHGSNDTRDDTHWLAQKEDVFEIFKASTKEFTNLEINRKTSTSAASDYPDKYFDMIFIDMGHTREDVLSDIMVWLPKVKDTGMICGHDYLPDVWMGVIEAVDQIFGKPDGVCETIWWVDLAKRNIKPEIKQKESPLETFTQMVEACQDFTFVKLGDGEMIAILGNGDINGGKNIDGSSYTPALGRDLLTAYKKLLSDGTYFGNMFEDGAENQGFRDESYQLMMRDYKSFLLPMIPEIEACKTKVPGNMLLHQQGALTPELFNFYNAIRSSKRRKIFIGPKKLQIVSELLKAEFMEVAEVDAFTDTAKFNLFNANSAIVLVSAGMGSKLIISKIKGGTKIDLGSAFDPLIAQTRTNQVSQQEMKEFYKDWLGYKQKYIIPRKIFTVWLSKDPMPEMITTIIETQKLLGYKHHLITLKDCPKDIPYVTAAIEAKKWVKACDYLRMYYLYKYGGIFMDADMEILPGKNFDAMLSNQMFAAREENGFVGYSLVGSIKGHPLAKRYLDEVNQKFKGDDNFFFEASMEIFTKLAYAAAPSEIKLYEPEYFFPYNHQTGVINVTGKTISFHHFLKTWKDESDILPTVSILIPQLGREDGLKRCLESIDYLYYPKHLIEVVVIEGLTETVPEKIAIGLKKSKGEIICYGANDTSFDPYSLYRAVQLTRQYGLVAFNTGELLPDKGNICEHFIIRRDFIKKVGGEIFSTKMRHVGVDNLLWLKADKLGQAVRCEGAIVHHYHFSKGGQMDEVYKKGWENMEADREILNKEVLLLQS